MNVFKIIVIVVASVFAGLCIVVYFALFKPFIQRKKMKIPTTKNELPYMYRPFSDSIFASIDFLNKKGYERVFIKAFDKRKLAADLFTCENAKGTVICCHGFQGWAYADMGVAAQHYLENGYNVLLIYQRAHFESEGRHVCFGIKERYDCLGWINFINSRFGEELPLYLYGISMGAATVLMCSGFDLPKNVKSIIADCGFTSPYEIFRAVAKHIFPFIQIAQLLVFLFAGYNIKQYSTLTAMKKNKVPVIFFHGLKDSFVPSYMTEQNYEACIAEKELYLIPNAKHTQSLYVNPEFYWEKIDNFMSKHL